MNNYENMLLVLSHVRLAQKNLGKLCLVFSFRDCTKFENLRISIKFSAKIPFLGTKHLTYLIATVGGRKSIVARERDRDI